MSKGIMMFSATSFMMDELILLSKIIDEFLTNSFILESDFEIVPFLDASLFIVESNNIALSKSIYRLLYSQRLHLDINNYILNTLILTIKPEYYSAWNIRKKWILKKELCLTKDLNFTTLLLSKYPKKATLWTHRYLNLLLNIILRKWLIKESINRNSIHQIQTILKGEFRICDKAAGRYESNYHAWDYRRYILSLVKEIPEILDSEFKASRVWCFAHVNDCSGWSYRKVTLMISKKYRDELEECTNLINITGDIKCVVDHIKWLNGKI